MKLDDWLKANRLAVQMTFDGEKWRAFMGMHVAVSGNPDMALCKLCEDVSHDPIRLHAMSGVPVNIPPEGLRHP